LFFYIYTLIRKENKNSFQAVNNGNSVFCAFKGGQQGGAGGGDSDNVMDSLLLDIRCGFPMRDKVSLRQNTVNTIAFFSRILN